MAGKRNSPWGAGRGGKAGNGNDSGDGSGPRPDPTPPPGSSGPRNPWLPPESGSSGNGNVENIFARGRGRGGGGGGGNFRMPQRPGGKSWFPVAVVAIVALGLGATMFHVVDAEEQGVVKTLGNYTRTLEPGFNISAPWPIETVDIVNVDGVRAIDIPTSDQQAKLILTGDQNLVDLSYVVRWNIQNLENFKFELVEPIETVSEVAEAAMRASVAEKTLDETFSGQGRAEIELAVRERMQRVLDGYAAGINILGVEIDKADPPGEVVDAFRDVSVAEQNADAARNQARGYAQQVLAQAEGEAEAFNKVYEQYRLAPEVTRQRLYYETMERVLRQTDKTIVEPGNVTTYLPLPEIRKRAQQAPSQGSSATVTAPTKGGQ
ncbi:protease modulator HflK [Altererythrobacter halimionae]|uniref:Protease modulator HflK n=2 Tax=Alteriqipengyuania halimionae TaxID=1926630 RepID=A0A6I4TZ77_9SPHN|nr:protease modulator HflK [Alteriqipengyuania halimionae]